MTTLLEAGQVAPPQGSPEMTVPVSMFDIMWLHFHPIRRLIFYDRGFSTVEFIDTVVVRLKNSLSLALKHFLPVAGKLIYPNNKEMKPVLRYVSGDSVSLTVAESVVDFDELVGNHIRDADQFYDFIPPLPAVEEEDDYKKVPLFAVKLTVFPGLGFCIGITNHHALGDANSIFRFMTAWASICNFPGEEEFDFPIFDRAAINDHLGIDTIYWKVKRELPFKLPSFPLPTNRVRATFIVSPENIKSLKEMVLKKKPELKFISSFVVTTCYTWTCLVKSGDAVGEEVAGDVSELLGFAVDVRNRVDPPIPETYFGNCLAYGFGMVEHQRLTGEDGFATAAVVIAEDLKNRVNKKDLVLKGAENWMSDMGKYKGVRPLGISGSPKFDISGANFGWGKARKLEVLSIDGEKYAMSLCKSSFTEPGGLEIGLSLPELRMAAFAAIFADGLRS